MTRRRTTQYNAFGESVSSALADRHMVQNDIATATNTHVQYVNRTMTKQKMAVSPEWVDLVASALKMQADERTKLHRAAASVAGYKIGLDLTPSKKSR